jgi:hypothetical protein
MLRRQPTSVTLTAADVEMFKQLIREQQQKKEPLAEDGDSEPDDVFMGRSIDHKRTRDLNTRLGIEEDTSGEPLFKRIHL